MALVLLFYKHSSPQNSEWMNEISKNGIDSALSRFCRQIPVSSEVQGAFTATKTCQTHGETETRDQFVDKLLFQVTPAKFLRTAFGIRGLSSAYISRVFLRTEMALKSRNVLTGSRSLVRSRSTDNLPTSQSQVNIQMMSHTLTIREVCAPFALLSSCRLDSAFCLFVTVTKIIVISLCRRVNSVAQSGRCLSSE